MDQERLDQLIAGADKRAAYTNQVDHAKERFRLLNTLAWNGHIFELTPHFMGYVILQFMSAQDSGASDPIILLDRNDEPVLIEEPADFVDQMHERHHEALNEYHDTYLSLQLARSTEEIIEAA